MMKKRNHFAKLFACIVLALCMLFSGSVVFAAEADTEPPTTPANLRVDHSTSYIYLFWNPATDNVGVDHYDVTILNRDTNTSFQAAVTDTVYSFHAESDMRAYRYEVAAVDAAGNRSRAAIYEFSDYTDEVAPSAITGLTYFGEDDSVYVKWNASTDNVGVDHYELTLYNHVTGKTTVENTNELQYRLCSASYPISHDVTVVAVDAAGNQSESATITTIGYATDPEAPSRPTNLKIDHKTGYVYVSWDASTDNIGVDHYEVTIYNRITKTSFSDTTTETWYSFHEEYDMRAYRYEVVAVDAAGNRSGMTSYEFSNYIDETAPSAITGLTYTAKDGYVYVKWNASTDNVGVDHYELTIYHYAGDSTAIVTTTDTEYAITPMVSLLDSYRVTVVAVDAAGNRSVSATVSTPGFQEDKVAPSMPANISILDGPTSMHLAKWDPSTDNVGVDHYEITLYHYNNPEFDVYDTTTYNMYQWQTNGSEREYSRIVIVAVDAAGNRSDIAEQRLYYHPFN